MTLPRYPGYDVLSKRDTPSWDDITRQVIDERLHPPKDPRFFDAVQWKAVRALCDLVVPQMSANAPVPVPEMLDTKLITRIGDGYRDARLPSMPDAWRIGLAALDAECRARYDLPLASIDRGAALEIIKDMQAGKLTGDAWQDMPSDVFFSKRVLHDICGAYYSHPHAWNEMGFGGPANPRGYVRMVANRRDPWEAAEAKPGKEDEALKENRRVR
ncbi:gluconate 2-dehydrogenase subunit 3 family protein [Caballeronia sp. LZ065]|uniref:gluconate 2-dehydrogenase subunit 3 family protein n=1 Tax=Caballeronia sp. LZ065 TaxID=3038571 RepID=UPI00285B3B46|nr:gluconate 2-dehydrogenase subunit 3 family protein [Caballeronia sp. LZ065]MDR5784612.1 gluconate 2-dehydrogenase subunit 3 family protein [Caballeronia sp. LZ065]